MRFITLLLSSVSLASAATVTDTERDKAVTYLESTRTKLLDAVNGLSNEQWNWKSSPDRWSVAECVEHIALTEQFLLANVKKTLTATPNPEKSVLTKDALILRAMPDRSRKATAPSEIAPKQRFPEPGPAIAEFEKARAASSDFIKTSKDDLRAHVWPHPAFGDLDEYQWLLLIAGHAERHTKQIDEVKATAGFPAK